jgi:hypothetical protein
MSQTGNPEGYMYPGQGDTSNQAYILNKDYATTDPEEANSASFYFVDY